jgi:cation diffusion facilitator CzcD-associated flavoprotein CzcO
MLHRAGYDDVSVFERGARVGGVWHANTYPGAACDVPSHLYELSFSPNPNGPAATPRKLRSRPMSRMWRAATAYSTASTPTPRF